MGASLELTLIRVCTASQMMRILKDVHSTFSRAYYHFITAVQRIRHRASMRKKYICLKKITSRPIKQPSNQLAENEKLLKIFLTISDYSVCQKKIRTIHLQGLTLFTRRESEKCQKLALFTCRGHTFHLHGVRKNSKRKFTLFTITYRGTHCSMAEGRAFHLQESENAKRKFILFTSRESHFLLAGVRKMPKKVHNFHLQGASVQLAKN